MESDPTQRTAYDNDDEPYWPEESANAAELRPQVVADDRDSRLQVPITEYILNAQQGDSVALEALMGQYRELVQRTAWRNPSPDVSFDDRVQHGLIGFWQAVERFTFEGIDGNDALRVRRQFFAY